MRLSRTTSKGFCAESIRVGCEYISVDISSLSHLSIDCRVFTKPQALILHRAHKHNIIEAQQEFRCLDHREHSPFLRSIHANDLFCLGEGSCRIAEAVEFTRRLRSFSETLRDCSDESLLAVSTSLVQNKQLRKVLRLFRRDTATLERDATYNMFCGFIAPSWPSRVICTLLQASAIVELPRGSVVESTCSACASSADPTMVCFRSIVISSRLTRYAKQMFYCGMPLEDAATTTTAKRKYQRTLPSCGRRYHSYCVDVTTGLLQRDEATTAMVRAASFYTTNSTRNNIHRML